LVGVLAYQHGQVAGDGLPILGVEVVAADLILLAQDGSPRPVQRSVRLLQLPPLGLVAVLQCTQPLAGLALAFLRGGEARAPGQIHRVGEEGE
jgi:hypothetical protein